MRQSRSLRSCLAEGKLRAAIEQPSLYSRRHSACLFRMRSARLVELESSMGNLTWVIVAIGALVGGPIMMLGFRRTEQKLEAFPQIDGAMKQDWIGTGKIDFLTSAIENSSDQPLTLLVEEKRVTESAVGQDIEELRWRLATLEEGKQLVLCWNASRPDHITDALHQRLASCVPSSAAAPLRQWLSAS
jgi:hypothetical protein